MSGYMVLEKIVSESSGNEYEIRRGGDLVLYCQCSTTGRVCQGWLSNKNTLRKTRREHLPAECKHTRAYVARTGASYGPQYEASAPVKVSNPAGIFKKVSKVAAVPQVSTKPATKDWRSVLLAEQSSAVARGVSTPAAAMAEFKAEVRGRFANLDIDLGDEG